ncbi:Pyrimidine-nucleoside phosphorylase [Propionispora sp. 2/2-37]|uniref:pyrimidine-nucleoside phosphorylase n=1 Tax=Propionispora sp. 2/2-37 TaxID=1677858 RepID=UPI0006BB86D4|nr:pyrimidine-nucleoside phosphorylase [Propionispora sp. 2/2-37]CUH94051.1 Pyrimidine-nucleoside phosphorylase [Propionispora sp. 2/2-37]
MHMVDCIAKKRNGEEHSSDEIKELITAYTRGDIPDYQMAAWLMAVYLNGMSAEETSAMTRAMAQSGKVMNLDAVSGIKVDKHSTGGVADTTTLVVAPLVAAAGVPVSKMSGRGLGFTGGTIDKLESIPGFRTMLTEEEFIANLNVHGLAVTGQTPNIAPADGRIYALRDVTATVESIPLIASSIMSKKIAAGADKILLDVKVGRGAFMKSIDKAVELAQTMVTIGETVGRQTVAVLTNMEEPLGQAVGNSLEVWEALEILKGKGCQALRELCLILGAHMMVLANQAATLQQAYTILEKFLLDGLALAKFCEFIEAQGGNAAVAQNYNLLPQAKYQKQIKACQTGYIQSILADQIGYAAMRLGAGREFKEQPIDLAAGILLHCRVGDRVEKDQVIATVYASHSQKLSLAGAIIEKAIFVTASPVNTLPLLLGFVDKNGYKPI